jgi:hypothetical protein
MAHAEGSVTIDRPVTTVFNFIADGSNNPLWRSSVTDIQRVPDKPQGLGAVFKQGLKGPGGRIDGDNFILHWFAHYFKDPTPKLRKFIQEQNSPMGKRDLARFRNIATTYKTHL